MTDQEIVKAVSIVNLKPGDVICVKAFFGDSQISSSQKIEIMKLSDATLKAAFPNNECLVYSDQWDVTIYRKVGEE